MKISQNGIALIKRFEGFRSAPYQCQAGVWTIGWGHTRGVTSSTKPITHAEAEGVLQRDLVKYEASVNRLITRPLTQNQFDALVSFTFNLGGGALQRSSLRMKINRGDFDGGAREFLKWVRAGGKVSYGLLKRRMVEQALFLSN